MANQEVRKISIECTGSKSLLPGQQVKLTAVYKGKKNIGSLRWETGKFATPQGTEGESITIEGVEGAGGHQVRVRAYDIEGNQISGMTRALNFTMASGIENANNQ